MCLKQKVKARRLWHEDSHTSEVYATCGNYLDRVLQNKDLRHVIYGDYLFVESHIFGRLGLS